MGLNYENLDNSTRQYMLHEWQYDIENSQLYISDRLNEQGKNAYPLLLKEAISDHNDDWLAEQIVKRRFLNLYENRRKPNGGYTQAKVPIKAAETLAQGEFNRFYIRGLCLRGINNNISYVEVYRGKQVTNARSASMALIGQLLPVEKLLQDLRTSIGVDTALNLPPGPNSGLTVRLKE